MRQTCRKLIAILSLILLHTLAAGAQTATPQISVQGGYRVVTFETPQGKLRVYVPDDMQPSDIISGSVVLYPNAGSSFEGYFIDAGGKRSAVAERFIKFIVPAGTGALSLTVVDGTGVAFATATVPVVASRSTKPSSFELPKSGQAGRPLEIPGAFDGDFATTRAQIGDQPAALIAESPRKLMVIIPLEPLGPATFSVTERSKVNTGEFRSVGVSLSAPKTTLKKGETTTLTVLVSGLQGITLDVPLDLVTTGAVDTEGGNSQYLRITPEQVQADGRVTLTRTLTAAENGNFNVTANIIVARRANSSAP